MKYFLDSIKQVSPKTQVFVVGYLQFVGDGRMCLNGIALNQKERKMIHTSVTALNSQIARATKDAGATSLDIENVLDGGKVCEGSKYVTFLYRIGILNAQNKSQEFFHPNPAGHKKIAEKISPIIATVRAGGRSPVWQDTSTMSDYFPGVDLWGSAMNDPFMPQAPSLRNGKLYARTYAFGAHDQGKTSLHSDPVDLGKIPVVDGYFDGDITIPDSVPPGPHVLEIQSKDADGNDVTIYQFIFISKDGTVTSLDDAPTDEMIEGLQGLGEPAVDGGQMELSKATSQKEKPMSSSPKAQANAASELSEQEIAEQATGNNTVHQKVAEPLLQKGVVKNKWIVLTVIAAGALVLIVAVAVGMCLMKHNKKRRPQ